MRVVDNEKNTERNEIRESDANFLIKSGVIVFSKKDRVTWSFDLMRTYWLKKLSRRLEKEVDVGDINNFTTSFLKFVPWDRLKESLSFEGVEKVNIKNEAYWQNEFFRAAVWNFGIQKIFPEFGGNLKKGEGKVDFYINSARKWMFEFFIGDDERKLYYERFNSHTGTYKDFDFKNFQIINIVVQKRKPSLLLNEKWKGISFLHFSPDHNLTKATLRLFKRNPRTYLPLTPQQIEEEKKNGKDGNEWLKDGDYEEFQIEFTHLTYNKTLSLQLYRWC